MELMNQKPTDWTYLRFQYEILGMSADEIAKEASNLSVGLIEQAIAEGKWKSGNLDSLVPVLQKTEAEEGGLEAFIAATKAHLVGASLVKQKALFPTFAKCEAVLLSKIMLAAQHVDPTDEKACNRLSNLVKCLQGLLSQNSFLAMQASSSNEDADNRFTIQIMQQVN